MSNLQSIEDLLEDNLKDLYSAEKQLTKALPKMAKNACSPELKEAIEQHLKETEGQIDRLEQIGTIMDFKLTGKKCKAMEGLVEEGKEAIEMKGIDALIDAGIVVAAQKVEHYEISGYGSAKALAEKLGLDDVVDLLEQTLQEESAADEKLTGICQTILAADFESEDEDSENSESTEDDSEEEDEE